MIPGATAILIDNKAGSNTGAQSPQSVTNNPKTAQRSRRLPRILAASLSLAAISGVAAYYGKIFPAKPNAAPSPIAKTADTVSPRAEKITAPVQIISETVAANNIAVEQLPDILKDPNWANMSFEEQLEKGRKMVNSQSPQDQETGLAVLGALAHVQSPNARVFYYLGQCYSTGVAVEKDERKAFELYEKGLELGDKDCRRCLARCLMKGIGTGQNAEKALTLFQEAVKDGDHLSELTLGLYLVEGKYLPRDPKMGLQLMTKAADSGNIGAMFELGRFYILGIGEPEIPKDLHIAARWLEDAAKKPSADELAINGILFSMYRSDLSNVPNAPNFAYTYGLRAAELGNFNAMLFIADDLWHDWKIRNNDYSDNNKPRILAREWLEKAKAAAGADPRKRLNVAWTGLMLISNEGKDPVARADGESYLSAIDSLAASGDKKSIICQALCTIHGLGVPRSSANFSQGMKTLMDASENGNADAAYMLGLIYVDGITNANFVLFANRKEAQKWFDKSGALGGDDGRQIMADANERAWQIFVVGRPGPFRNSEEVNEHNRREAEDAFLTERYFQQQQGR